ncbi:helix-turn-helix transcriptional regulator [Thioclava sp. GXIMD4215]|uniref:S24 family peptidase n=1 Tax=Thioclava sp. GXIMD4215 TaxID=3131928 RepID=UPI003247240F
MDVGEAFQSALRSRLDELKLKPSAAELAYGLKPDTIRNVLRENQGKTVRRPRIDTAYEICQALKLDFYIGPKQDAQPTYISNHAAIEFAHVPAYEASLAAGDGYVNADTASASMMAFRRDWLRKIGVSPDHAVLARIANGETGESMLPSICPGDMVLIDTARKEIPARPRDYKSRKSPIFAFATEDGARVKRLATMGEMVILVSDNPDYPPEFLTREAWANVNVIGKVVWWGHTAEE